MSVGFIFLSMIFCHILDDWVLQGKLADFKQRSFWKKNAPEDKYRNDYIIALYAHSFSWTFMIMLPIAWYNDFSIDALFFALFAVNTTIHAIVDDEKANEKTINLITDQLIHLGQIVITFLILVFFKF